MMSIYNSDAVIPAPQKQDVKISPWFFKARTLVAGIAPGKSHCSLVIFNEKSNEILDWEQSCNAKPKVMDFLEKSLVDGEWQFIQAEHLDSNTLSILENKLKMLYDPV